MLKAIIAIWDILLLAVGIRHTWISPRTHLSAFTISFSAGAGQFPQNPSRVLAIKHSTTNQSEVKTRLTYFGLFPPVLRGEVVEKLSRWLRSCKLKVGRERLSESTDLNLLAPSGRWRERRVMRSCRTLPGVAEIIFLWYFLLRLVRSEYHYSSLWLLSRMKSFEPQLTNNTQEKNRWSVWLLK